MRNLINKITEEILFCLKFYFGKLTNFDILQHTCTTCFSTRAHIKKYCSDTPCDRTFNINKHFLCEDLHVSITNYNKFEKEELLPDTLSTLRKYNDVHITKSETGSDFLYFFFTFILQVQNIKNFYVNKLLLSGFSAVKLSQIYQIRLIKLIVKNLFPLPHPQPSLLSSTFSKIRSFCIHVLIHVSSMYYYNLELKSLCFPVTAFKYWRE